jgi:hypothetical protein
MELKLSHSIAVKIYEIASYVLILGATVVFLIPSIRQQFNVGAVTLIMIALAVACRWGMERHRFKSANDEIDQLQADLRRLTQLLAEEKKKNKNA